MPVFSLTDIQFNTPTQRKGVNELYKGQDPYNIYRYPLDLGSADKGHYMLIQINEQIKTSFPGTPDTNRTPTVHQRKTPFLGQQTGQVVDILKQNVGPVFENIEEKIPRGLVKDIKGVAEGLDSFIQTNKQFGVRTVRAIKETIAIYMPDTLKFDYNQSYDEMSSTPMELIKKLGGRIPILSSLLNFSETNVGQVLLAGGFGAVTNPMMEVLYRSPELRKFAFDFLLYPRSEKEALEVQWMIEALKFHQAPEIAKGTAGLFLRPPSEFDISFYYNGKVNPNIPKISTCVLNGITVDYVPNGNFSAYEIPGRPADIGGTGMPVGIRLSLQFTETEYLVKGSPILSNRGLASVELAKMQARDPTNIV